VELDDLDIHIWPVKLIASDQAVAAFEKTLSAQEAERCGRFHFEQHRRAYALAHGALRWLLARYLGIAPDQIAFRYGPAGKPALDLTGAPLEFNMSHTQDLAVYAFARRCQLGVDVEHVKPMPDLESVARRFFSAEECSELFALAAEQRVQSFFRCWTRKEAYVKATGEGILMALDTFQVSLAPEGTPLRLRVPPGTNQSWHLHAFVPGPGYLGAVAYDGAERAVREWPLVESEDLLFNSEFLAL